MFNDLSLKHSLFMIHPRLLEEYKGYPKQYSDIHPQYNVTHSAIDTCAAAFNTWLLLISKEERLVIDQAKTFSHSFNIMCTNEMEKSNGYLEILARFDRSERFVVSCFVTSHLHRWKREIMQAHHVEDVLVANLQRDDYYWMNNSDIAVMYPLDDEILQQQAKMVKILLREIRKSNSFERCIKQAINESKQFLRYRIPVQNR
ncbi:MAG: hypothetical protein KBT36_15240 [Kurthia sp.]|nr:hypothetical protein [Candidatus Kurthia equi]